MRTIIDLPEDAIEALDRLRRESGRSRAALVREAIERYLDAQAEVDRRDAFGAWRDLRDDGLTLQRRLRSECEQG